MSLLPLIAGLAVFFAMHDFTTRRQARAALIERMGLGTYRGFYSLVSAVGLVLIIWGFGYYRSKGYITIWDPPRWMGHINLLLMLPALILLAAAYLPGKISAAAKHPMLAGTKLWAFGHLLTNGDLGSILLFGSFLAYGVYDRIAVKKRAALEGPGKAKAGKPVNDLLAIGIGGALYIAIAFLLHPVLFGVSVLPGR